jgi:hypothetical protein
VTDLHPSRPKRPLIVGLVVLAGVLALRAWFAADNGLDRGAAWFLLAAAVALAVAIAWAVTRSRATRTVD